MGQGKHKIKTLYSLDAPRTAVRSEPTDEELGVPPDSFIYDPEYQELREQLKDAVEEMFSAHDEKPPSSYKPREEWNEEDEFMYDLLRTRPISDAYKSYLDRQKLVEERVDTLKSQVNNYERNATRNRQRLTDIPSKPFTGDSKYFKTTTGIPYYDDFLTPKGADYMLRAKGLRAKVVSMPPQEYIQRVADQVFHSNYERQLISMERKNIAKYANQMKLGSKAPMPYLNLANEGQEGRHRAFAAMLVGAKEIPVLVVY